MRDSMLDARPRGRRDATGVVLLDLPDHDSTEVSHHLEVDRLVQLADLLVWVLDPQKYADAAIHDRYLAPLATHRDVMLVVLNHIDTVPGGPARVDARRRPPAARRRRARRRAGASRPAPGTGEGIDELRARDRPAGGGQEGRPGTRLEADLRGGRRSG